MNSEHYNVFHPINPLKQIIAKILCSCDVDWLLHYGKKILWGNSYLYAVNYHHISDKTIDNFEKQLQFYQKYFSSVSLSDLDTFFNKKKWFKPKPGLIISFDDGYYSHCSVAYPLLEKYGFIGWFMVPTSFPDIGISPAEQQRFALEHLIPYYSSDNSQRLTMSWDEIKALAQRHVIGCHTHSHYRLHSNTAPEKLYIEIKQAKSILESKIGKGIEVFCWVGGEEENYSGEAAQVIYEAKYRYSFMTNAGPILPFTHPLQLQRINIECEWPLEIVRFQLNFIDLFYTLKRHRVNHLTSIKETL